MVVTCMGGLGRSGTLAARGPRALETIAQEDFAVMSPLPFSGAR